MGLEAACTVTVGRKRSSGIARLEARELVFRGDVTLRIPFDEMQTFEAKRGRLVVVFPRGTASFHLGEQAEKWALKIRYPRSLIDKLGVKPGSSVSVLGLDDARVLADVRARSGSVVSDRVRPGSDLVFLSARRPSDLRRLRTVRRTIATDGAIWVVWPKDRPELREDDVRAAARAVDLVDVKVVSFSEALSALKLVVPLASRTPRRRSR